MASSSERKAAQAAKIAEMSLAKRIAITVAVGVVTFLASVLISSLINDDVEPIRSLIIAAAVTSVTAYQYLVVPARR